MNSTNRWDITPELAGRLHCGAIVGEDFLSWELEAAGLCDAEEAEQEAPVLRPGILAAMDEVRDRIIRGED